MGVQGNLCSVRRIGTSPRLEFQMKTRRANPHRSLVPIHVVHVGHQLVVQDDDPSVPLRTPPYPSVSLRIPPYPSVSLHTPSISRRIPPYPSLPLRIPPYPSVSLRTPPYPSVSLCIPSLPPLF